MVDPQRSMDDWLAVYGRWPHRWLYRFKLWRQRRRAGQERGNFIPQPARDNLPPRTSPLTVDRARALYNRGSQMLEEQGMDGTFALRVLLLLHALLGDMLEDS